MYVLTIVLVSVQVEWPTQVLDVAVGVQLFGINDIMEIRAETMGCTPITELLVGGYIE